MATPHLHNSHKENDMNIMPNASSIKKAPSHKKRNIVIAVVVVVLLVVLGVGSYFMFFTPQAKITNANKKVENLQKQLEAIPSLDSKENIDKFKQLTKEIQAAQNEQANAFQQQLNSVK
jgi:flagellar basal body-associated protein FliL